MCSQSSTIRSPRATHTRIRSLGPHNYAFARLGPKKLTLAAEYADTATPSCQLSVLLEVPSGWRVER